jgi:hypothetical protein
MEQNQEAWLVASGIADTVKEQLLETDRDGRLRKALGDTTTRMFLRRARGKGPDGVPTEYATVRIMHPYYSDTPDFKDEIVNEKWELSIGRLDNDAEVPSVGFSVNQVAAAFDYLDRADELTRTSV